MMHDRVEAADIVETRYRRRWLRWGLLLLGPLVIVGIGVWLWLSGVGQVTTDNSYVQQDKVAISPDITGRVERVAVRESQPVKAGDILFTIDPEPFRIVLAEREAALAEARQQARMLGTNISGKGADLSGKREAVGFAEIDLARQTELLKQGFTTRARHEEAQHALAQARSELASAEADLANARAAMPGGPIEAQPRVMAAKAARDRAALDMRRTIVRAPIDGLASQTDKVVPGAIVALGFPTLSVVRSAAPYVEANFKETDLTEMRVGQKATIRLDAYPDVKLTGHVESIGAGTGSEFSVLPAQNATGNWVKVVQRVPVRIAIDGQPPVPMIAGLSAEVTVRTQ